MEEIRRLRGEGLSISAIGHLAGHDRKTARRYLDESVSEPRCRRLQNMNGFYYHFIDPDTGLRGWDDSHNTELTNPGTGTMIVGAIVAGEYFGGEVEDLAEERYTRTDWNSFTNPETRHPYLACYPEDTPDKTPFGGMN